MNVFRENLANDIVKYAERPISPEQKQKLIIALEQVLRDHNGKSYEEHLLAYKIYLKAIQDSPGLSL